MADDYRALTSPPGESAAADDSFMQYLPSEG